MATDLTQKTGRWRRPHLLLVIALAGCLLLALGAGWDAISAAQSTPPAAGTATPAVTPAPDARRLTIDIGQLNDSGVTGTATLYEAGKDQTIVEIAVKNVSGNHPAHIHVGTCEKIAPEPAYDLQNIDKSGKSTTLIKVSLDALLAKPYVIDAHLSPNELGTLIMCGEIKGTPVTPTPTVTATTPAATTPAATTPAATTPAPTTPAAVSTAAIVATTPAPTTPPTAVATTPAPTTPPTVAPTAPPSATVPPTTAVTPTGVGGETGVAPTATTPAVTPVGTKAAVTPAAVTSGKGNPAVNGALGGDGTGGSTANSTTMTGSAAEPLASVDGSGASGTATVFPADGGASAVIQVSLRGDLVGPDNLVHLHIGTCSNLDPDYTVELNPLNASGVSETVVDIPYEELLTGGYAINVHASADDYDTWLVCGELSASAGASTATGAGGQTANLLPLRTGAGTSLPRPETVADAIAWALGFFALLIGGCALLVRRRESHRSPSRWLRLGL